MPDSSNRQAVLALDQGGHASRAFVVGLDGSVLTEHHCDIATFYPAVDRVEHDPLELVSSFRSCLQVVAEYCTRHGVDIVAAGLATQRSSMVCWDRHTGSPLTPVLSWQDRRNADWLRGLTHWNPLVHERTGLRISAHYGAGKMRWCLDHLPEVAAAYSVGRLAWGPLASFLLFHLVREHPLLVDPVNASRTLLWGLSAMDWDGELLALFHLDDSCLPRCVANLHAFGMLDIPDRNVPLSLLTGDQPAALFAYGAPDLDTAYINMGTGAFVQRLTHAPPRHAPELLSSVVYCGEGNSLFGLEGTVNGAGSAIMQLVRELAIDADVAEREFESWLQTCVVPPLFLNGVSGLGSPYWRSDFNSRFVGNGTPQEKLVAVAESVLFLINVNLAEMSRYLALPRRVVATGGWAKNSGLCQRLANLTGLPVHRPGQVEATALGLAWLLARPFGQWSVREAMDIFTPAVDAALQNRYQAWLRQMTIELQESGADPARYP